MQNREETKKEKKNLGGRPTLYSEEMATKIAELLTCNTIRKTCEIVGINTDTYYNWIYKHNEFFELSNKARKTKAIKHFAQVEEILDDIKEQDLARKEDVRSDILRLQLDFHMRLAGKANQGLFGDQSKQLDLNVDIKDVSVPKRLSQEEWLKQNSE